MRKVLVYLIFILLACSSVFALTVSDLKPNDRAGDMQIIVSPPFYKEKEAAAAGVQPFSSYEDVEAQIFIYDSPNVDAPKGYDLMVIFEEWRTETQAKNRFEKDFSFEGGFQECNIESREDNVKKCEKLDYPRIVYVLYYQNFLIRLQPHKDHTFTTQDLFYLSLDIQKVIKNIVAKISFFEREPKPPQEEIIPIVEETPQATVPEEQVPEEAQPGFFSRNKYYILGGIVLLFILFWMYKTRRLLGVIFVVILGLIILNISTVFTKGETIGLVFLWIIIYMLVHRFYRKKIKKKK